jgi:hypothetical protein
MSLLNTTGTGLSLANFLGKGKTSMFGGMNGAQLLQTAAGAKAPAASGAAVTAGVNVNLSEEAKALLEQSQGTENTNQSGLQKYAQNFLVSFFDESGIDFTKLSDEAYGLLDGMLGVIEGSGATGRDVSTDIAEQKYANGNKKVYTLTGANSRLRIAIDYADGSPSKLSITDISGGIVETAEVTLEKKNGAFSSIEVERTQKEYRKGHMVTKNEINPLSINLYKS